MPDAPSNDPIALVAAAQQWLDENPDAPMTTRAAFATVVACGGDPKASCTYGEIAEHAGADPTDARRALYALREQNEVTR